ncbi:MAG: RIP metalloprotease RseP [Deltaproteobacteria bacterium]|nr:RIP metalloprotease RseP [Deltaproteobacteria bacterium]
MTTLISFIIVLGVLIFIHELGHFAVAKACGVGVEKFSLGFGPKLIGIRRGETEYRISLLPLGGYVKMVGEAAGESVSDELRMKSFTHKPVWKRALIVAAGPTMNLVLAIALLPVIFMIGIQLPAYLEKPAQVGYVVHDEPAEKAGIKAGDTIVSFGGKDVKHWEDLLTQVALNPSKKVELTLERDGQRVSASMTPDESQETGAGYGGMYPPMKPVIGDVASGYPAKEAGIKAGDTILSIDGVAIRHWAELENAIHKAEKKITLNVLRDGKEMTFEVTPRYNEDAKVHLIGISRQEELQVRQYGFTESVSKGVSTGVQMTGKLFVVIKGLVLGEYSLKTLGGPIMIAQVAGKAAESGISDLLSLVAFLSLQLGIINLFPIPVLDGGHIVFFGLEAIKGKPLSEKFMTVAQQVGIALLIGLMVLVTWNDLVRIFS